MPLTGAVEPTRVAYLCDRGGTAHIRRQRPLVPYTGYDTAITSSSQSASDVPPSGDGNESDDGMNDDDDGMPFTNPSF